MKIQASFALVMMILASTYASGDDSAMPSSPELRGYLERLRDEAREHPVTAPSITPEDRRALQDYFDEVQGIHHSPSPVPSPRAAVAHRAPSHPVPSPHPSARPSIRPSPSPSPLPPRPRKCVQRGCKQICTGDVYRNSISGSVVPSGWRIAGFTSPPPFGAPLPPRACISLAGPLSAIDRRVNNKKPVGQASPAPSCANPKTTGGSLTVLEPVNPAETPSCPYLVAATDELDHEPCISIGSDNGNELRVCLQTQVAAQPGPQSGPLGGPNIDINVDIPGVSGRSSAPERPASSGSATRPVSPPNGAGAPQ